MLGSILKIMNEKEFQFYIESNNINS